MIVSGCQQLIKKHSSITSCLNASLMIHFLMKSVTSFTRWSNTEMLNRQLHSFPILSKSPAFAKVLNLKKKKKRKGGGAQSFGNYYAMMRYRCCIHAIHLNLLFLTSHLFSDCNALLKQKQRTKERCFQFKSTRVFRLCAVTVLKILSNLCLVQFTTAVKTKQVLFR